MQRLDALLKHIFYSLSPFFKCRHNIHSTQWETFIQSIHTKNISKITNPPNDADKAGTIGKEKVKQTYLLQVHKSQGTGELGTHAHIRQCHAGCTRKGMLHGVALKST